MAATLLPAAVMMDTMSVPSSVPAASPQVNKQTENVQTMKLEHQFPQRRIGKRLGRFLSRSGSSTASLSNQSGNEEQCSWRDVLVEEAGREDSDILRRRPDRISITLNRPSADVPLGFRLSRNDTTGQIRIEGKQSPSVLSTCNPSALIPGSMHSMTFFEPGDTLDTINDTACRNLQIGEIKRYLDDHTGRTTLAVSTANKDNEQSHLCQAIVMHAGSCHESEASTGPATNANLGITFGQKHGLLRIQKLAPDSWFGSNTSIHEGDLVVAINQSPCIALSPDDAQCFLDSKASCSTCLSITTIAATDAERRWAKVKKAAVAVGGGTMVGVGAIIMATPLHPVGHAMAIGGVGVLGTEFDAPKRAAESARSRLMRSSSTADGMDDEDTARRVDE